MKTAVIAAVAVALAMLCSPAAHAWDCSNPLAERVDVGSTLPAGATAGDGNGQYYKGSDAANPNDYYVCEVVPPTTPSTGTTSNSNTNTNSSTSNSSANANSTSQSNSTSKSKSNSNSSATGGNAVSTATGGNQKQHQNQNQSQTATGGNATRAAMLLRRAVPRRPAITEMEMGMAATTRRTRIRRTLRPVKFL